MKNLEKVSFEIFDQLKDIFQENGVVLAWTGGKDSTVMLDLVRRFHDGKIPYRVFFNDSTMEFPEVYDFIDRMEEEWELDLIRYPHSEEELAAFAEASEREQKKLAREMKVNSITRALDEFEIDVFVAAIRHDEHPSRSKEKHISPRPSRAGTRAHTRVHPVLHFTEEDIWDYIREYGVPYVSLYDQGYRSLGEMPFTAPAQPGEGERSGRDYDKEKVMSKLRDLGYW